MRPLTALWACLLWAGVQALTTTLQVKQGPHADTQLYVAPPTHNRKDGRALPSTIIISRPLGIRGNSEDEASDEEDSSEEDSSEGSSLHLDSKIKFYRIECSSGQSCSAIIPARTTTSRPAAPDGDFDVGKYLARFGLRDGFPYSDDFESSGSPVEDARDGRQRAFASSSDSSRHYWPGSAYRPRPQSSMGLVFKHQQYDPPKSPVADGLPTRRPAHEWHKILHSFPTRRPATEWQLISPSGSSEDKEPPSSQASRPHPPSGQNDLFSFPQRPSTRRPVDGVWNRYSTSTVSQLDRDSGEWVKVSSSSTHLDQGVSKRPSGGAPSTLPQALQAVVNLTVLGPSDSVPQGTRVVEMSSALPGRPPALIETHGGQVESVEDPSNPRRTSSSSSASSPSSSSVGFGQVSAPFFLVYPNSLVNRQATSSPTTTTTTSSTPTTSSTTSTTTTPTTTTTTTRPRPSPATTRVVTTTAQTTPPPPADDGSIMDNPYAVMAAVGAGLIPATFVALLPAFVGRRRRSVALDLTGDAARQSAVEELSAQVERAVRGLQD